MVHTIFIVDDDDTQLMLTEQVVSQKLGYRTIIARGGREAIERFLLRMQPQPDLLLIDLMMPEVGGMEVIKAVRRSDKQIPIIVMSAFGGMAQAVAAIEAGANDFLMKPMTVERLKLSIHNQIQRAKLSEELARMARQKNHQVQFSDIIGRDERLLGAISMAKRAVESTIPVLLQGERGTGKELLARTIHGSGSRAAEPFYVYHCANGSEEELQWLLQGTGESAGQRRPLGRGTLYLKQVEALSPAAQAKVLAALEAPSDWLQQGFCGRIIASCQGTLMQLMQHADLCDKLSGRLHAYAIDLPALRTRKGDVAALAEHYVQRFGSQEDRLIQDMNTDALKLLMHYDWPGNIAELVQQVQRAVIYCDSGALTPFHFGSLLEKTAADLSDYVDEVPGYRGPRRGALALIAQDGNIKPMQELEAEMIQYAIRHYGGRMSEVARRLGIGRSTLYRKMHDYNIEQVA